MQDVALDEIHESTAVPWLTTWLLLEDSTAEGEGAWARTELGFEEETLSPPAPHEVIKTADNTITSFCAYAFITLRSAIRAPISRAQSADKTV